MLASVLPGFRDLRVPLAAGFLWLAVLWLIFSRVVPTQDDATGLAADVYRVAGALGTAALIAAVTFLAYFVGILVAPATGAAIRSLLGARRAVTDQEIVSMSTFLEAGALARRTAAKMVAAGVELPSSSGAPPVSARLDPKLLETRGNELLEQATLDDLIERMEGDIPLVATRLLANNRDLFDRYDRAEAEASFRFAISIPVLVLSAVIPLRLEVAWWGVVVSIALGIVMAFVLIVDGARRQVLGNDAVYQAVFVGEAAFPSIEAAENLIKEKHVLLDELEARHGLA